MAFVNCPLFFGEQNDNDEPVMVTKVHKKGKVGLISSFLCFVHAETPTFPFSVLPIGKGIFGTLDRVVLQDSSSVYGTL